MSVLKNSQQAYINSLNKSNSLKDKIVIKEAQIERLNKRIKKINNNNWWGDILIRPLMEVVKNKFPEIIFDDERLIPMGMRCAISIFGKFNEKTVCAVTFTIGDLNKGELFYDTGEIKDGYSVGSIGNMNGFNRVEAPIDNINVLIEHINRQVNKDELIHLR